MNDNEHNNTISGFVYDETNPIQRNSDNVVETTLATTTTTSSSTSAARMRTFDRHSTISTSSWSISNSIDNDSFFLVPTISGVGGSSMTNNNHQRSTSMLTKAAAACKHEESNDEKGSTRLDHYSPTSVADVLSPEIFKNDFVKCRNSSIKNRNKRSTLLHRLPEELYFTDLFIEEGDYDDSEDDIDDDVTPFQHLPPKRIDSGYYADEDYDNDDDKYSIDDSKHDKNSMKNNLLSSTPKIISETDLDILMANEVQNNVFFKMTNWFKNLPIAFCLPSTDRRKDIAARLQSPIDAKLPGYNENNNCTYQDQALRRHSYSDPTHGLPVVPNIRVDDNARMQTTWDKKVRKGSRNINNTDTRDSSSNGDRPKTPQRSSEAVNYNIAEYIEFDSSFNVENDDDDVLSLPDELM